MRYLIGVLALVCALAGGIYIGAHPETPVLGALKDVVAPDEAEIPVDQAQTLIEQEFYRKVPESELTNNSINGMVKGLDDKYSHYFDPKQNKEFAEALSGSYTGVGMAVNDSKKGLLVTLTYPDSPAREAGIRHGDIITKVNGKSIAGQSSEVSVAKIKGKEGTKVTLTVLTDGKERDVTLTRRAIDLPIAEGKLYKEGGNRIGVVQLISFTDNAGAAVAEQVEKLKKQKATSFVLDLRGNGGGRLDQAVEVSSVFIESGMIVATDGRSRPRQQYDAVKQDFLTAAPLAVLVDKGSASASEITAGAVKYRDRGLIVGTRTYGKGVFQEITELSNGGAISLTVGRYELPGGHYITKAGLKPDLEVEDANSTKPDEALDAAFEALAEFKQ